MRQFYLLFLFFIFTFPLSASHPIKMAVISDIHFLSPKLAGPGEAYRTYKANTGRNIKDLHNALDFVFKELKENHVEILLITGDLTNHGERQSHLDLIEKLKLLSQKGIRIFVIPGNHDINIPNAKTFLKEIPQPTSSITPKEFEHLYNNFGYKAAFKKDPSSLSYAAELDATTWLLAIDSNRYDEYTESSITAGTIKPGTLKWIIEILKEANRKNIKVFAMMHHGLVEHMPYQSSFFSDYLVSDWYKNAEKLSNEGLQIIFTGHFHANDITLFNSTSGNQLYDIETGSMAQYPFPYRIMEWDGHYLSINSFFVESLPDDYEFGKRYKKKAVETAQRLVSSKLNNIGMSLDGDYKIKLINLLTHLSIQHLKGDEIIDEETKKLVKQFAEISGDVDFDIENFSFDFPPEDNNIRIKIK